MSTNAFNPVLRLVHGTIETVPVAITDALNAISSLASPTFSVTVVNPTTQEDGPLIVKNASATSSGLTILNSINTTVGGEGQEPASVVATNIPTNPLTVVTGTNDEFVFNGVTYTVPAGVYTGLSELAAAMNSAVDSFGNLFTEFGLITISTTHLQANGYNYGTIDAGLVFNTGTHDVLTGFGFTNGQALAGGTVGGVWEVGQYGLYVSFLAGGDTPILGRFDMYIV